MRRPYLDYCESGVSWIGAMPRHWGAAHLRRHVEIVNGGTPASGDEAAWDGRVVWLTPDDLGRNAGKSIAVGRRNITEHGVRSSSATVCPGDSVVVSTRAPIGHLAVTSVPTATNQGCRTLVPSADVESDFVYYALLASQERLEALGKGSTFMELSSSDLGEHRIPVPPLDEQRAIAAYLDSETARIDELISKQELLIERLDEYRTALITQVVTKGLPPEAAKAAGLEPAPRFKHSGVEWLGDIPEDWSIVCIRHLCRFEYGESLTAEERVEGNVPVYGSNGVVGFHDEPNTLAPVIIIGRKGSHGKLNFDNCEAFAIDTTYFVDPACTETDLRWLYYALHTAELDDFSKDSAVPGLSREDAYAKRLPRPPAAQQCAIARFLDAQSERIDRLCAKAELSIERLREYRSALVLAAVTGKIDVRDEALAGSAVGSDV